MACIKVNNRLSFCSGIFFVLLGVSVFAPGTARAQDQGQGFDPLAEFRRNAGSAQQQQQQQPRQRSAPNQRSSQQQQAPLPTPGGFQQPGGQQGLSLEELDLEARMALEEAQAELERETRELAFDGAIRQLMPMTPEEIARLLEEFRISREAAEQRVGGTPKPEITVETVSLDPGTMPPTINVSPGYVTSVNMMDVTGKPWPVESISWGGDFEIITPGEGGHVIRISPMQAHALGNLSVQLVNLDTPVTFAISSQLERVQYRFDARIPEYGPLADMPIIDVGLSFKAGANPEMSTVLQGIMPAGAQRMEVEGVDGRTSVFRKNGQTFVRTPLTLLSPGWSESAKSADGMTVYVIHNSPVLLLSEKGKMVRAMIKENEVQQP